MKKVTIMLALLCVATFAQQKGSFTDSRDGKTYKMVTIGTQTWMAENLDYGGKNGDIGVCYDKKAENCKKYGTLYFWKEAKDKICPSGWHLPSNQEWKTLADFAGGPDIAGKKLKSKSGWVEHKCKYTETTNRGTVVERNDCATDEFSFSALPGGVATFDPNNNTVQFMTAGEGIIWFSATTIHNLGISPIVWAADAKVSAFANVVNDATFLFLCYVRCIKDQ